MDTGILTTKLEANKTQGFNWQQRRHSQWTESYELYRDTVIVNRLLQRQSVNIPLMKVTIRTLLSKFKKNQDIVFEELDNDKQKEIFMNEYWAWTVRDQKLKIKNIVSRKVDLLYGRVPWKLNVSNGKFTAEVLDPQDVLIDRYADPADIGGTAQFIIHQHIFRTLKEVANNTNYNSAAVSALKVYYATEQGLIKAEENRRSLTEKNERMSQLGVPDIENPVLGETIVELNEHYVKLWDEAQKKFVLHIVTMCGTEVLMDKPLKDVLGVDFFPILTWADDVERSDIWSDGISDIIRTINKVLNAWFSQLIENRTLRNFGMNFYDSTAKSDWTPQTFDPIPFGWYPLPGKPSEVFESVKIDDLKDSLTDMEFLMGLAEKATGATPQLQGTGEKDVITLGEVQILLKQALDRVDDTQDIEDEFWKDFGEKWAALVDANADSLEPVKLFKKGYKGNYYTHDLSTDDWKSKSGYSVIVKAADQSEEDKLREVQKLLAVRAQFPNNQPLAKIVEKKMLDVVKLSPEESKQVMDFQEQLRNQPQLPQPMGQPLTANANGGIPQTIQL